MRYERTIGHISVDAGICMIGDPCYTLPDDASHRDSTIKNWDKFVEALGDKSVVTFNDNGLGATSIVVETGWGDGTYPVTAIMEDNKVLAVFVNFSEGELEWLN